MSARRPRDILREPCNREYRNDPTTNEGLAFDFSFYQEKQIADTYFNHPIGGTVLGDAKISQ